MKGSVGCCVPHVFYDYPVYLQVRIRITKPELEDLLEFLVLCREEQHWDLIYVWKKLIKDRAFYWSASGIFFLPFFKFPVRDSWS